MIEYFKTFMKIKNNKFIGIDFEFNRIDNQRKVALFQIIYHISLKTIFMFYPPDLNKKQ